MGDVWKPRKRQWPNGKPYWIVAKGDRHSYQVLVSEKGNEDRFPQLKQAKYWAGVHNEESPDD